SARSRARFRSEVKTPARDDPTPVPPQYAAQPMKLCDKPRGDFVTNFFWSSSSRSRHCLHFKFRDVEGAITSTHARAIPRTLSLRVDFRAGFVELSCLLFEPPSDCGFFCNPLLGCVFSYVFCYLHTAKMGSAHGAEVRSLRSFLGKSFVVELTRRLGV